MTYGPRDHRRTMSVAVLVGVLVLVTAGHAAAHNELVGSTPADGATVAAAPAEIALEFDQPVQTQFGQIAVLDAIGGHHEQGEPQIAGVTVTQDVDQLAQGAYQISYRVASADGHPISGTLTFTVAAAAPTPSTQTASPSPHKGHPTPSAAAATIEQTGNTSALFAVAGGVVAAAVMGAVLYVVRAGRRPDERGEAAEAETGQ